MVNRKSPDPAHQDTAADTEVDGGPFAQPLMPGTMVGEYRVERKIGEGGMGTVYGAIHPVIGKRAAIKLLRAELSMNPEAVERFLGEARAVNQIGHPNIVDVFSFGALPDGRRYFAMEWLHGESLAGRLDRDGGLPLVEALPILDQVVAALAAAHERGIVHRDLKPDNVFLCEVRGEAPRVKLLDFGIAKLVGEPLGIKRTKTGALMGTPGYIAPEQARGEEVDTRADIYALGCMAFELLTGRLPFISDSAMVVITKHLTEDPPAPSAVEGGEDLPPEIDGLVLSMLAKDRAQRPGLADVRARLAAFGRGLPATTGDRPRGRRVKGDSRAPTVTPPPAPSTGVIVAAVPVAPAATMPGGAGPRVTPPPALDDVDLAPPPRRWPMAVAGVGVVAAVIAVVAIATGGSSTKPAPSPGAAGPRAEAPSPPAPSPPAPSPPAPSPPAPSPPAPSPVTGTAAIQITGARAPELTVDGERRAVTDGAATLALAPGEHDVVVTARRMKTERRTVTIVAGATAALAIALAPERARGSAWGGGSGSAAGSGSSATTPTDDDALLDPFHKKKRSGGTP
ncbi:MAG: serine/threonine protein kinase [Myxococcales bacterium]|nr:serine/threonine protein kinase [Myxococcales bacterium]MBK7196536.1 serine/threonine protein kinase [Myxococcales bacterium]MBP6848006.1 serine/threonine protein kinase [Kofleriaceae bacterium]